MINKVNAIGKKIEKEKYDKALQKAIKLQNKIARKIDDPAEKARLQSIVQVLINSLNQVLSPNTPPSVAPTANPTAGTEPLLVNFMANASDPDGTIDSILWLFGDGGISSDANPSHTYACDGDYTASVQATDNQGAVASGDVTINVASAGGTVNYDCDVQTVFDANCISCHGSSAGLNVQSCENLQAGSNNGPMVDPGSKETSVLWQRIDNGTMPPIGGRLPQADIDGIGAWIDSLDPSDPDYCD